MLRFPDIVADILGVCLFFLGGKFSWRFPDFGLTEGLGELPSKGDCPLITLNWVGACAYLVCGCHCFVCLLIKYLHAPTKMCELLILTIFQWKHVALRALLLRVPVLAGMAFKRNSHTQKSDRQQAYAVCFQPQKLPAKKKNMSKS